MACPYPSAAGAGSRGVEQRRGGNRRGVRARGDSVREEQCGVRGKALRGLGRALWPLRPSAVSLFLFLISYLFSPFFSFYKNV
jgi:hypothetical protein